MSDAKQCDYCGKFFTMGVHGSSQISGVGLYGKFFPAQVPPPRLDFCPTCAEEFRNVLAEWWKDRKRAEHA